MLVSSTSGSQIKTTVKPNRSLLFGAYRTKPSNEGWKGKGYLGGDPPPGYSVTDRGWLLAKKYEEIVESLTGVPYLEFCREFLLNDRLVLQLQDESWDCENKVAISSDYRRRVHLYIINKAHDILWGLSSGTSLTEDDWYNIHEHSD